MRHRVGGRKLGLPSDQRMALLRGLVRSFVELDRIQTTATRAKEVRPMAEKLITRARRNDLHARRETRRLLNDETPQETGEDGRATLEIIYAAYESAGAGKRITWPYKPKKPGDVPVSLWLKA